MEAVANAIRVGDSESLKRLIESLGEKLPPRAFALARQTLSLVDDGDCDLAADVWREVRARLRA